MERSAAIWPPVSMLKGGITVQDNIFVPVFGVIITLRHLLQIQESLEEGLEKLPESIKKLLPVTGGMLMTAAALQMVLPVVQNHLRQKK